MMHFGAKVYVIKPKQEKNKDGSPAPWSVQTDGVNLKVRYNPANPCGVYGRAEGRRGTVCVRVCVCVWCVCVMLAFLC